jgi:hypothetical protein
MHLSSIYLLACLFIASTHGWSNFITSPPVSSKPTIISRRAWITKSVAAASALTTAMPAWAEEKISDKDKDNKTRQEVARIDKKAQKEQADREKEARRVAEETKKRLAVGRIGTI